ncbi:hypothetical protein JCM11251_004952 [Rhodosporidiobolus azoricus]
MLRYTATATRTLTRQAQPLTPRLSTAVCASLPRYHTSAVLRAAKPVEEQSAQHPGKSDIEHLENPSLSEEAVHADREAPDPLSPSAKASAKAGETAFGAADGVKNVADQASSAADNVAGQAGATLKKAAEAVKDAVNTVTGGGKRTFSTTAISRNDKRKDDGHEPAQHLDKSGHDHLDKPSVSEETTHADRSAHDPLPDEKKASNKTKSEANQSAGVKDNVSEAKKKDVDDLPDGESTLRSIGGSN